jgi:hypothetical protein
MECVFEVLALLDELGDLAVVDQLVEPLVRLQRTRQVLLIRRNVLVLHVEVDLVEDEGLDPVEVAGLQVGRRLEGHHVVEEHA